MSFAGLFERQVWDHGSSLVPDSYGALQFHRGRRVQGVMPWKKGKSRWRTSVYNII